MTVGQVINLLLNHASKWDSDGGDEILLLKGVYSIEVLDDECIKIYFTDGNTRNYVLNKDGEVTP